MNLYERYGKLLIQAEILNNQIAECKKLIAEEINKKALPAEASKEEPKKE